MVIDITLIDYCVCQYPTFGHNYQFFRYICFIRADDLWAIEF